MCLIRTSELVHGKLSQVWFQQRHGSLNYNDKIKYNIISNLDIVNITHSWCLISQVKFVLSEDESLRFKINSNTSL